MYSQPSPQTKSWNQIPEELVQIKGQQSETSPDWKALIPGLLDSAALECNSFH